MDAGQFFKDLVWDLLVKAALAKLFAMIPLLGWGPIGMMVTWVATHFADKLFEALRLTIQLEVIYFRNEAHRKAFDAASVKLKIIAKDKGIDSPEFKAARDEHKKALSVFVQFG